MHPRNHAFHTSSTKTAFSKTFEDLLGVGSILKMGGVTNIYDVMLWAGIFGNMFLVPVRVTEVVKLTAATYSNILNEALDTWVDVIQRSLQTNLVIIDDKSTSRSVIANQTLLRHNN